MQEPLGVVAVVSEGVVVLLSMTSLRTSTPFERPGPQAPANRRDRGIAR
jgi:hypothetical protein